jgi:hypothetical protein
MSMQRVFMVSVGILLSMCVSAQKKVLEQGLGLVFDQSNVHGIAMRTIRDTAFMSNFKLRLRRYGIIYQARMDIVGSKAVSLSAGSSITIGYSSTGNNGTTTVKYEGNKGTHLAFDIPVFFDLNIGLHSAKEESKQTFGVYAGVGYAYSYTKMHTSLGLLTLDGFDPVFRAGFRMGKRWENRWGMALTMRGSPRSGAIRAYGVQLLKEL